MTAAEEWAEARRLVADAAVYQAVAARHLRWVKVAFGLVAFGHVLQMAALALLLVAQ